MSWLTNVGIPFAGLKDLGTTVEESSALLEEAQKFSVIAKVIHIEYLLLLICCSGKICCY